MIVCCELCIVYCTSSACLRLSAHPMHPDDFKSSMSSEVPAFLRVVTELYERPSSGRTQGVHTHVYKAALSHPVTSDHKFVRMDSCEEAW